MKEYVTIGTKNIAEDIFRKILKITYCTETWEVSTIDND